MGKATPNNHGRSIDGLCSFPNCDNPATELIAQPICTAHCLKVYRAAQALVEDATPRQVRQAAGLDGLGVIYFIQSGERIKIGHTTDLGRRLKEIPHDRVLAAIPGSLTDEKRAHAAFAEFRDIGEWFHAEPGLLHGIATMRFSTLAA